MEGRMELTLINSPEPFVLCSTPHVVRARSGPRTTQKWETARTKVEIANPHLVPQDVN